jgi:Di- and tricarboxylate transporters
MTNDVIWLIVLAFFFARGFVRTGLGDRVATMFVRALGKSTLGLSYGLTISEAILAPAMPSTTARAGGVYLPIIQSLAKQAGSEPGPTSRKARRRFWCKRSFHQAETPVPCA